MFCELHLLRALFLLGLSNESYMCPPTGVACLLSSMPWVVWSTQSIGHFPLNFTSQDVQNLLGHRQGIDSFLIKPVQRITKYQLLLRDLHRSAQKAAMETPNLEKALHLMQDVPKRANDAMTLSMIYGYEGNIHASGQIILQVGRSQVESCVLDTLFSHITSACTLAHHMISS